MDPAPTTHHHNKPSQKLRRKLQLERGRKRICMIAFITALLAIAAVFFVISTNQPTCITTFETEVAGLLEEVPHQITRTLTKTETETTSIIIRKTIYDSPSSKTTPNSNPTDTLLPSQKKRQRNALAPIQSACESDIVPVATELATKASAAILPPLQTAAPAARKVHRQHLNPLSPISNLHYPATETATETETALPAAKGERVRVVVEGKKGKKEGEEKRRLRIGAEGSGNKREKQGFQERRASSLNTFAYGDVGVLLELAEEVYWGTNNPREGIVVRPQVGMENRRYRNKRIKRLSFKVINDDFWLEDT
ncbi:hypothetical protein HDV00_000756 [Rhizophlyctis rosea]|nr:hypothetical protein HDV00_000756 [Rhizophlyctis rosea]